VGNGCARGGRIDLIVIHIFTTRNFNGPWSEVFPDEGFLRVLEKSVNVGCPLYCGVKHPLGPFKGQVLDDRIETFRANLVLKHTELAIGL
jgi:hypothetical protein